MTLSLHQLLALATLAELAPLGLARLELAPLERVASHLLQTTSLLGQTPLSSQNHQP